MRFRKTLMAGVFLAIATPAQAEQYSIATFIGPTHIITRYQHQEFADNVRDATGGEIDFEVFAGGALLPPTGTLEGISNGVAQVSVMPPTYAPSALPVLNAVSDLGWLKPDSFVLAFAYADFNFNDEAAKQDWKNNGVLYGAGHATPVYHLMCTGERTSLEDLQGAKTRSPGASYARVMTDIGLSPVNISSSESYTGLERGALDCVAADLTFLVSGQKIGDLVDSVVLANFMPYFSSAGLMYDRDFWQGISDENRRHLLDEGALSMVRLQMAYAKEVEDALQWAKDNGKTVVEADAAFKDAVQAWVDGGLGGGADIAKEKFGIEDPDSLFSSFAEYVAKWEGLLAGVDRKDEDALLAVLKENIFDKVDVKTYGVD
ncbi:C4-dicarboxylate TRAP transporter substrate-binding protein [Hoeflea sp.]|uniref:C4-dicarboxylate TRAP transporter substrate-binding protein n=1 Tax=Hoeflea sp. TaxID=1940281 RepID=UPI003B019803